MASIIKSLEQFFARHGTKPVYWLGLSGGLDSQVLVHACYELSKTTSLTFQVLHVNHGLSPHSSHWQTICESICKQYQLPFTAIALSSHALIGGNVEAVARAMRYRVFADAMQPGDMLITAHHQDDQAETFLVQLFRGAGPKGLASMPRIKPFACGFHARPLLKISRAQCVAYAKQKQLHWVEDETNTNTGLTRNFIRHAVMPLLAQRWPTIACTIARSAEHCAEQESVLAALSAAELTAVSGSKPQTLSVSALLAKSAAQQRLLIRAWLMAAGIALPSTKKLLTIQKTLLHAKHDRTPQVSWQHYQIRRFQGDLYVLWQRMPVTADEPIAWDTSQVVTLPGIGQLTVVKKKGVGLSSPLPALTIRFRQGGERIHLGKRGHKTLKNLFQEWAVAPWQRNRIPLLYAGDRLIQIVGYCLDPAYQVKHRDEEGYEIIIR
jgi:tRNA(Ile)-lysidine synthase